MSNNGGNLTVQYNLRWSEEMRDKIAAAAKENTRSMNQEIIARLEHSFVSDSEGATLKNIVKSFSEMTSETTRLQSELIEIINEQKEEIERLKKAP
jgi:hypothetical protein